MECSVVVLPEPVGPGGQDQAERMARQALERVFVTRLQTQLDQWNGLGRGQQAQYHIFQSVVGGHDGDAQLQLGPAKLGKVDLAVLRSAPLRDIQPRHDLDARHQRRPQPRRQAQIGFKVAVAAKADQGDLLARIGLDVNVGSVQGQRVVDHLLDHAHHARGFTRRGGLFVLLALRHLDQRLRHQRLDIRPVRLG
jgi:hypothetical protein